MSKFTWLWLAIGAQAVALEAYALATDHQRTLSQTLQRAFAHAPWPTLLAFGTFAAWFTVHIWGRLFGKRK